MITSVTHKNTAKTLSEFPAEANAAVKSKGVLIDNLSKKSAATDTNMQITKNDAAGSEEDMISPPRKSKNEPKANQSKAQRNKANIPKKMGPKMAKMNAFLRENFDAENCRFLEKSPDNKKRFKITDWTLFAEDWEVETRKPGEPKQKIPEHTVKIMLQRMENDRKGLVKPCYGKRPEDLWDVFEFV